MTAAPSFSARSAYHCAMPSPRRFPSPWSIKKESTACFIVRDGDKQALAYVYFEIEPGRRSSAKLWCLGRSIVVCRGLAVVRSAQQKVAASVGAGRVVCLASKTPYSGSFLSPASHLSIF